jgi:predicted DCC family thiol-disulfide oxidoreductase YuxK
MQNKLIFLFDGGCPLCLRETNFLKSKDELNKIDFVDINNVDYNPILFKDISYAEAMSNLHGILENGNIIKGLDVLAYSYELIGLGWVYYPLKIEFFAPVLRLFYKYWAKYRLKITGRSNIEKLCTSECKQ